FSRVGIVGEKPRVDETRGGPREVVIVIAFAHQVGDVELIHHLLAGAYRSRRAAGAEAVPIGPIDDFLRSAANDVAPYGDLGQSLAEPDRQIAPPRRVDREHVRTF